MTAGRTLWAGLRLLDRQLVDRNGRMTGMVDDLLLSPSEDGQHLYVTAILSGPGALAQRLDRRRYGNWMQIDHPGKLTTVYGHLSAFAPGIEAGTRVSQGELVGFVGNTGRSTGAHLHFEIQNNGRPIDPVAAPSMRCPQLAGADLASFKKQVAASLAERERESRL